MASASENQAAFAFTKLVVSDLDRAVAFYGTVFGMVPRHRVTADNHAFALDEVIMAPANAAAGHPLILTRYLQRPCPAAGCAWTGFMVGDIAKVIAATVANGGAVAVAAHENADHGVVAALLTDPEGHLIEVVQPLSRPGDSQV